MEKEIPKLLTVDSAVPYTGLTGLVVKLVDRASRPSEASVDALIEDLLEYMVWAVKEQLKKVSPACPLYGWNDVDLEALLKGELDVGLLRRGYGQKIRAITNSLAADVELVLSQVRPNVFGIILSKDCELEDEHGEDCECDECCSEVVEEVEMNVFYDGELEAQKDFLVSILIDEVRKKALLRTDVELASLDETVLKKMNENLFEQICVAGRNTSIVLDNLALSLGIDALSISDHSLAEFDLFFLARRKLHGGRNIHGLLNLLKRKRIISNALLDNDQISREFNDVVDALFSFYEF
jgi:hypothetical protein